MPLAEKLTNYPVDADYIVNHAMTIDGTEYKLGDTIPGSLFSDMPRRLQNLCEQRALSIAPVKVSRERGDPGTLKAGAAAGASKPSKATATSAKASGKNARKRKVG